MTPNVGALLAIVLGLVLVYVAVKGSQATFFGSLLHGGSSAGSSSTSAQTPPASGSAAPLNLSPEFGVLHGAAAAVVP